MILDTIKPPKTSGLLFLLLLCLILVILLFSSGCGGSSGGGGDSSGSGTDSDSTADNGTDGSSDTTDDTDNSGGETNGSGAFIVSIIGGTTSEAGNAATFTVRLPQEPTSDVSISLSSNDESEGWADPSDLTFTPSNWSSVQTVLVRGVDDYIDDGDITYAIILDPAVSTDASYDGEDPSDVTVVNIDNDALGVERGNISGNTTEWGKQATFTLRLESAPTDDVTIPIESSDLTEGTVEPSYLVFTPENWNSLRTVTVTGQNDGDNDGHIQYSILLGPAESSDSIYEDFSISPVNLFNYDDDNPGFTIQVDDDTTWEWGDTAQVSIKLASSPQSSVTIGVSSSNISEGSVFPDSVSFNSSNWDIYQTITITGVDDTDQDGNTSYDVVFAAASSDDTNYDGEDPADKTLSNIDDDSAGFNLSISSGSTSESGGAKKFSLHLTSQPGEEVTIPVSSDDLTEGDVNLSSLVFDSNNWFTAQTVKITGIDDDDRDGDITYSITLGTASSSDASYDGLSPDEVPVTNIDNDIVGFIRSSVSGQTTEGGGTATFTIKLKTNPYGNVYFPISSSNTEEATVSPAGLTFTPSNWEAAQTVTITGVDDVTIDGDIAFTVILDSVQSNDDSDFDGLDPDDINLTNLDNDTVGITVSNISRNTSEAGGTASFTIVLEAPPTSDVSIELLSTNTDEGIIAPSTVVFNSENWDTLQQVLVAGQDDYIPDDNVDYTIVLYPAVSSDPRYHNLDAPDVSVTNIDNDVPGFTATPSGIHVGEGEETTFSLKLNTLPSANVSVDLSSSDETEATISPAELTFTPSNWTTNQTATVTGIEDNVIDGTQYFNITLSDVSSDDPDYSGMDPADLNISSEESYGGTNLALHFPFTGNANDAGSAGNDGTPFQVTLTTDRLGSDNSAYYFDGTGYISTTLDADSTGFYQTTWMAWIMPDQTSDTPQTIFCVDDGGRYDRCLDIGANSMIARISNGNYGRYQPINMDMNLWQHVAVVYRSYDDGAENILFYKNGVEYDLGGSEGNSPSTKTFHIGVNPDVLSNFFHGKIDDVRVYNTALSPTDIRSVYGYYTTNNLEGEFYFTGNVDNSSGNGSQAYNYGASLTEDRSDTADSAYQLDGSNDYIQTSIDIQPSIMPDSSWSAWVKPTEKAGIASADHRTILCSENGNYYDRCLKMINGTLLRIAEGGYVFWYPIRLDLNLWQHIAIVYSSGYPVKFYKNGTEYIGDTEGSSATTYPLAIGHNPSDRSQYFKGAIDDVKIYNRVLDSTTDIPGLFGYSTTNELAASFDFSGNVEDNSGSGARIYNNNTTLTVDRSGNSENAYSLDGSSSYLMTSVDVQPTVMPDSSWSAWIRPTEEAGISSADYKSILCTEDGNYYDRCLTMINGTLLRIAEGGYVYWYPIRLDLNLWQHITVVYSHGNPIKFYKNGVEYTGDTEGNSATTYPLSIGYQASTENRYFKGDVDEIKIYRKALSAGEVTSLFGYSRTENLAAEFRFTGNLNDSSGSGAQAYNYGAALATDRLGVAESAYQFDGTNDHIDTNVDIQPLVMPNSSWSAWIKPTEEAGTTASDFMAILCTEDGTYYDRCLTMKNGTLLRISEGGYVMWEPFRLDLNLWQHIAVVYSQGSPVKFYKNGVEYTGDTEGNSATKYPLAIGYNPSDESQYFEGVIDEVQVYDKTLSSTEVRNLYGHSISNNIVAHFPFSGNVDNSGDSGAQALNYGADLSTDRDAAANEAYAFDGTSDYIYTNIDAQPNTMADTTWMGWIYPQSTGSDQKVFCTNNGNLRPRCVRILSNESISISNGTYGPWSTGLSVTMDTWQHIAVVYDGGVIYFYLDGVAAGTTGSETVFPTQRPLMIGKDPVSDVNYYKGKMDDIRVYNKALTEAEIDAIIGN
jgi:concanavalin A-like lectin/glucanase superfamily protein